MKKYAVALALFLLIAAGLTAWLNRFNIYFAPYTIRQPGHYRVMADLIVDGGTAIKIKADDVTVDLNGHRIVYTGDSPSARKAYGIYANQRDHIQVRNGTIEGFYKGIRIQEDSQYDLARSGVVRGTGHVVEDMAFLDNQVTAINVIGRGYVIRNNRIYRTRAGRTPETSRTYGIDARGPGCLIHDNLIVDTESNGKEEGVGISLSNQNEGCLVRRNTIYNLTPRGPGRTFGIWVGGQANGPVLLENTITNAMVGIGMSSPVKAAYFENNRVYNAITSYFGCERDELDGGGNLAARSKYAFKDCYNPKIYLPD